MRRRSNIIAAWLTATAFAALSGLACAPESSTPPTDCTTFTNYMATPGAPQLSFATDIYPIFGDTNITNGCGQEVSCHGNPPGGLDDVLNPTKVMQFVYDDLMGGDAFDAVMAKAQLMMPSVNAPTMQRVVAGNVGQSFLAYKIAKERSGLACVNTMCVAGASVGNNMPCGDLMPSLGTMTDADRTKILDWIAQGARD
jgi:hypothetical protein